MTEAELVIEVDGVPEIPREVSKEVQRELSRLEAKEEARKLYEEQKIIGRVPLSSRLMTLSQLAETPSVSWLIDGVLCRQSYALLTGRDHSFKTFLALDWALCLATGTQWNGNEVEKVRVLYMAGEGQRGIYNRIRAWQSKHGIEVPEDNFMVLTEAVNIFGSRTRHLELVEILKDGGFGLFVGDTLRKMSGGANENGSDMGLVVDRLLELKNSMSDGSVLILHHTQKSDGDSRGNSLIEDDSDTVWHIERKDGTNTAKLKNPKQKDGPEVAGHIDVTAEVHAGSLVLAYGSDEKGPQPYIDFGDMAENKKKMLWIFENSFGSQKVTKQEIKAQCSAAGIPSASFYRTLDQLTNDGYIVTKDTKYWLASEETRRKIKEALTGLFGAMSLPPPNTDA